MIHSNKLEITWSRQKRNLNKKKHKHTHKKVMMSGFDTKLESTDKESIFLG